MGMLDILRQSRTYLSNGAISVLRGNYEAAINACNEALARKPDIKRAYLFRYTAHFRLGIYDAAILDTTDVISLYAVNSSTWISAHVVRSSARIERGNYQGAIEELNEIIETQRPTKPAVVIAYTLRSLARYQIGDKDNATVDIDHAEALAMKQPVLRNRRLSLIFSTKAVFYSDQGDHPKALELIDIAIEKAQAYKPKTRALFYTTRAHIRAVAGDNVGANKDLEQAKQLAGFNVVARAFYFDMKGEIEANRGDYPTALASFAEAIRLSPQLAGPYRNRSKAYQALGSVEDANRDLEKLKQLAIDPPTPIPPRPKAAPTKPNQLSRRLAVSFIIGIALGIIIAVLWHRMPCGCALSPNALYNQGDYQDAIIGYSTEIAADPNNGLIYKEQGNAYAQIGDYADAIADFKKALALNPSDKDADYMKAFIVGYQ